MDDDREWQRVDARILGQLLAAQNLLFVLPDATRIAGFFSQAMAEIPGVGSSIVCLGNSKVVTGARGAGLSAIDAACGNCPASRGEGKDLQALPRGFACDLAARGDLFAISIKANEHAFGFFLFRIDSGADFGPYRPFLSNLANFVAISLENRLQNAMLERARGDLEARTIELEGKNKELEAMNRIFVGRELRMVELKQKISKLEGRAEGGAGEP